MGKSCSLVSLVCLGFSLVRQQFPGFNAIPPFPFLSLWQNCHSSTEAHGWCCPIRHPTAMILVLYNPLVSFCSEETSEATDTRAQMANDGLCWLFTSPTTGITSKLVVPGRAPYLPRKARSNCSWKHHGRMTFLPSDSWIYLAQGALETVSTSTSMDNKMWIVFRCCLFAAAKHCQRARGVLGLR